MEDARASGPRGARGEVGAIVRPRSTWAGDGPRPRGGTGRGSRRLRTAVEPRAAYGWGTPNRGHYASDGDTHRVLGSRGGLGPKAFDQVVVGSSGIVSSTSVELWLPRGETGPPVASCSVERGKGYFA